MPPKKAGKKGKKSGKEKEKTVILDVDTQEEKETEKEVLLQQELDDLTAELVQLKSKAHLLKGDHEILQEKATGIRIQNHEYMSFVEKKAKKRRDNIVSLTDYSNEEVRKVEEQKDAMLADFEGKKNGLKERLLEKEAALASTKEQLELLAVYREKKQENEERVRELERLVVVARCEKSAQLNDQKQAYLDEKTHLKSHMEKLISDTSATATREAVTFLNHHTLQVQDENSQLRGELLVLIQETRNLQGQKRSLAAQQQHLLQEKRYADDLKRIRADKERNLADKLGVELSEDTRRLLLSRLGIDTEDELGDLEG